MALQQPGSALYSYFAALGWDQTMIGAFFKYAIDNAQYEDMGGTGTFTGTEQQMKKIRGTSYTTEMQKTQTTEAKAELQYGGDQSDAMIKQQKNDQQMIDLTRSMDEHLKGIYGLLYTLPGGSAALGGPGGGLLGKVTSAIPGALMIGAGLAMDNPALIVMGGTSVAGAVTAGDPMDVGDTLGSVNPDVRKRVQAMMNANPNLKISSGYRTARQQKKLYESGQTGAAPGKSKHGRGQAVDIGPRSQYGWIQANAKKFGLDHAAKYGEPWHVQVAGTMQAGDPLSEAESIAAWSASTQAATASHTQQQLSIWSSGRAAAAAAAASGTKTPPKASNAPDPTGVSAATTPSGGTGSLTPDASGHIGYRDFFSQVLTGLRVPVTEENLTKLAAVARIEGSHGTFNPFNSVGGGSGYPNYNSVGVKNYPDPTTGVNQTINLLSQKNTSGILSTLKSDSSFNDFIKAMQGFYTSWGGKFPDVSEKNASDYLGGYIEGKVGDPMGDMFVPSGGGGGGSASMNVHGGATTFHNTFQINTRGNVDVDSLVQQISVKLEAQMKRRQMATRR